MPSRSISRDNSLERGMRDGERFLLTDFALSKLSEPDAVAREQRKVVLVITFERKLRDEVDVMPHPLQFTCEIAPLTLRPARR